MQLTYWGLVTPYDIIELGQCRKPPGIHYIGQTTTLYWIRDHLTYLPISLLVTLLALLMSGTWTKHHHKPDHGHKVYRWYHPPNSPCLPCNIIMSHRPHIYTACWPMNIRWSWLDSPIDPGDLWPVWRPVHKKVDSFTIKVPNGKKYLAIHSWPVIRPEFRLEGVGGV